jgi:hypothetical protein
MATTQSPRKSVRVVEPSESVTSFTLRKTNSAGPEQFEDDNSEDCDFFLDDEEYQGIESFGAIDDLIPVSNPSGAPSSLKPNQLTVQDLSDAHAHSPYANSGTRVFPSRAPEEAASPESEDAGVPDETADLFDMVRARLRSTAGPAQQHGTSNGASPRADGFPSASASSPNKRSKSLGGSRNGRSISASVSASASRKRLKSVIMRVAAIATLTTSSHKADDDDSRPAELVLKRITARYDDYPELAKVVPVVTVLCVRRPARVFEFVQAGMQDVMIECLCRYHQLPEHHSVLDAASAALLLVVGRYKPSPAQLERLINIKPYSRGIIEVLSEIAFYHAEMFGLAQRPQSSVIPLVDNLSFGDAAASAEEDTVIHSTGTSPQRGLAASPGSSSNPHDFPRLVHISMESITELIRAYPADTYFASASRSQSPTTTMAASSEKIPKSPSAPKSPSTRILNPATNALPGIMRLIDSLLRAENNASRKVQHALWNIVIEALQPTSRRLSDLPEDKLVSIALMMERIVENCTLSDEPIRIDLSVTLIGATLRLMLCGDVDAVQASCRVLIRILQQENEETHFEAAISQELLSALQHPELANSDEVRVQFGGLVMEWGNQSVEMRDALAVFTTFVAKAVANLAPGSVLHLNWLGFAMFAALQRAYSGIGDVPTLALCTFVAHTTTVNIAIGLASASPAPIATLTVDEMSKKRRNLAARAYLELAKAAGGRSEWAVISAALQQLQRLAESMTPPWTTLNEGLTTWHNPEWPAAPSILQIIEQVVAAPRSHETDICAFNLANVLQAIVTASVPANVASIIGSEKTVESLVRFAVESCSARFELQEALLNCAAVAASRLPDDRALTSETLAILLRLIQPASGQRASSSALLAATAKLACHSPWQTILSSGLLSAVAKQLAACGSADLDAVLMLMMRGGDAAPWRAALQLEHVDSRLLLFASTASFSTSAVCRVAYLVATCVESTEVASTLQANPILDYILGIESEQAKSATNVLTNDQHAVVQRLRDLISTSAAAKEDDRKRHQAIITALEAERDRAKADAAEAEKRMQALQHDFESSKEATKQESDAAREKEAKLRAEHEVQVASVAEKASKDRDEDRVQADRQITDLKLQLQTLSDDRQRLSDDYRQLTATHQQLANEHESLKQAQTESKRTLSGDRTPRAPTSARRQSQHESAVSQPAAVEPSSSGLQSSDKTVVALRRRVFVLDERVTELQAELNESRRKTRLLEEERARNQPGTGARRSSFDVSDTPSRETPQQHLLPAGQSPVSALRIIGGGSHFGRSEYLQELEVIKLQLQHSDATELERMRVAAVQALVNLEKARALVDAELQEARALVDMQRATLHTTLQDMTDLRIKADSFDVLREEHVALQKRFDKTTQQRKKEALDMGHEGDSGKAMQRLSLALARICDLEKEIKNGHDEHATLRFTNIETERKAKLSMLLQHQSEENLPWAKAKIRRIEQELAEQRATLRDVHRSSAEYRRRCESELLSESDRLRRELADCRLQRDANIGEVRQLREVIEALQGELHRRDRVIHQIRSGGKSYVANTATPPPQTTTSASLHFSNTHGQSDSVTPSRARSAGRPRTAGAYDATKDEHLAHYFVAGNASRAAAVARQKAVKAVSSTYY